MHTARQLSGDLFQVSIGGKPSDRETLLGSWGPNDRFGVVVHEPYGGIGASYLLQIAITAFYDLRPARRSLETPLYPDVFAFHAGGRFGDYAMFDVYPPRKEVFVDNHPEALLNAINDRGITHLAVPDRSVDRVQHGWKEPAQALDRMIKAWAYSPSGLVADGDVAITATHRRAEANTKMSLHSKASYHEQQEAAAALGNIVITDEERMVFPPPREDEVSPQDRDRIRDERAALDRPEGRTETYREISITEALGMLHRGPAPAFEANPSLEDSEWAANAAEQP
jgi:hypothetical protein